MRRATAPAARLKQSGETSMRERNEVSRGHRVDLAELLSRLDNDRELLRELLVIFKEDFPRHHEALREAVARGDLKATKVVSHTLKGMLSNLAVTEAAAAAAKLEQLAGSGAKESLGRSDPRQRH
jgi:HPt (histidine-containing phosphotransfer) domain-containing protein